jgi:hypothetical protein
MLVNVECGGFTMQQHLDQPWISQIAWSAGAHKVSDSQGSLQVRDRIAIAGWKHKQGRGGTGCSTVAKFIHQVCIGVAEESRLNGECHEQLVQCYPCRVECIQ